MAMAPSDATTPPPISRKVRRDGDAAPDLAMEGCVVAVKLRTGPRFLHTRHMIILPPRSSATS